MTYSIVQVCAFRIKKGSVEDFDCLNELVGADWESITEKIPDTWRGNCVLKQDAVGLE